MNHIFLLVINQTENVKTQNSVFMNIKFQFSAAW